MRHTKGFILSSCWLFLHCVPDVGDSISLISGPRVLAIRSEPAEVFPGESVTLTLYAADVQGALTEPSIEWALCTAPKPPVEIRTISEACLIDGALRLPDSAQTITAVIPEDACARFGPDLPPQGSGDPAPRPRDPDGTGGYYQPIRAKLGALLAVGMVRIRCGVASTTAEVAARFRREYVPNRNPFASTLWAEQRDMPIPLTQLPADTQVTLKLSIPQAAQESFLLFDVASQALVAKKEPLRVSWLSAHGQLSVAAAHVSDGVGQVQLKTPSEPGPLLLWTVLRDLRGGVSVNAHQLVVSAPR